MGHLTGRILDKATFYWLLAIGCWLIFAVPAKADESLTLSITPPLFQITVKPGEEWVGLLKVVNVNPYDITVYAAVTGFKSSDEQGHGIFVSARESDEDAAFNLARWVSVPDAPIVISRESTAEIPITLFIPSNAEPGGHYAAILVGTTPSAEFSRGATVHVSSYVSSLLFVRISGNVNESGLIREFSTEKRLFEKPEVQFSLRFENTGNVHVQPRGEIVIYNMRGDMVGRIPVNDNGEFGNVLPGSARKFIYEWKGYLDNLDFGRFRSEVTLNFGQETKQNVFSETTFWIVPMKPLLGILGGLAALILFIVLAIRMYIRKMLAPIYDFYKLNPEFKIVNPKHQMSKIQNIFNFGFILDLVSKISDFIKQLKKLICTRMFSEVMSDNPLSDIQRLEMILENFIEKDQEIEREQSRLGF